MDEGDMPDVDPRSALTQAPFLAAILDHVAHPIFVKDRAFRFVLLNRALCDMVGFAREQMLGRTDYDFFPAPEADFFRQKDIEMFTSGEAVRIEEEPITDAHGRVHVLATTKVPLRDATGRVAFLVGIIHDVTRLKAAEEELRRANDELERRVAERSAALAAAQQELLRKERLAVLGRLAGGLAHQIRNPLGAIAAAVPVVRSALAGDLARATHAVDIIEEEIWRANRTITDLIEYARIRPALAQPVPVSELVEQTLATQHVPRDVHIVRDLPAVPPVNVDAAQTQGALENLVRNALDAMPRGGTLTISARRDGAHVVLRIADTGDGIPAEVRERMYEPLVTTKPLGLGLGLTTARALIENQRGSITFDAVPEGGTRFDVHLPLADDDDVRDIV
jgi:PAS domain S-box-containing protein